MGKFERGRKHGAGRYTGTDGTVFEVYACMFCIYIYICAVCLHVYSIYTTCVLTLDNFVA